MGRRSLFFLIAAIASAVLVVPSVPDLRWVPIAVSITYVVLAVLSALDEISRARSEGTEGIEDDAV
jgi:hypothetical protein